MLVLQSQVREDMELKYSITLTVLLLALLQPEFCKGVGCSDWKTEVYEIDYRGPETHYSFLPPPQHSRRTPLRGIEPKKLNSQNSVINKKEAGGR